jgi:hypothetical protein
LKEKDLCVRYPYLDLNIYTAGTINQHRILRAKGTRKYVFHGLLKILEYFPLAKNKGLKNIPFPKRTLSKHMVPNKGKLRWLEKEVPRHENRHNDSHL